MDPYVIIPEIMSALDGGTAPLRGHALPEYGYFVGGGWPELVFPSQSAVTEDRLAAFIDRLPTPYVGWWTDSDTLRVHVDGSDWYSTEDAAARVGRARGEIAFWDIARQREIRLAYVEGELSA